MPDFRRDAAKVFDGAFEDTSGTIRCVPWPQGGEAMMLPSHQLLKSGASCRCGPERSAWPDTPRFSTLL